MVAAQQQRRHPRFERRHYSFSRAAAGLRNLFQVVGALVASALRFGNLNADIAGIRDLVAESFKARLKPGDSDRGRPHVHAAPAGAQIQRHTDHANTARRLHRAAGRKSAGSGGTGRWFMAHRYRPASLMRKLVRAPASAAANCGSNCRYSFPLADGLYQAPHTKSAILSDLRKSKMDRSNSPDCSTCGKLRLPRTPGPGRPQSLAPAFRYCGKIASKGRNST